LAAALVGLIAAGAVVQALPGAGFGRDPKIRAVRAKADAFVSEASRKQNFGRAKELRVDAAPIVRTYVRFDVDLRSEEIVHVSLLLYSRDRIQAGYKVQLVYGAWNERKINFANAPEPSPSFVASGPLRAKSWKAVDVTTLVAGERGVTLALTTASTKGAKFGSRESGRHGPRLVVERQEGETTTSTQSEAPS
jgi:hypothetical protein